MQGKIKVGYASVVLSFLKLFDLNFFFFFLGKSLKLLHIVSVVTLVDFSSKHLLGLPLNPFLVSKINFGKEFHRFTIQQSRAKIHAVATGLNLLNLVQRHFIEAKCRL